MTNMIMRELDGVQQEQGRRFETPNRLGMYLAELQSLPGLVGLWNMGSVQRSTGNVYDLSGQGRTLTYTGAPTFDVDSSSGPEYVDLTPGTGDFLTRADETDLDILGTETIYPANARGLTLGAWCMADALPAGAALVTKSDGLTNAGSSYALFTSLAIVGFIVYNGANFYSVPSSSIVTGAWHFIVGRFTPSTEVALWVDGIKTSNTAGITASINNTAMPFQIGGSNGLSLMDGRVSFCFLSANVIADPRIDKLWRWGRGLFGV